MNTTDTKISFKYQAISSPIFGKTYRPVADVQLWSAPTNSWKRVQMVVDTGADYTILPRYLAIWLELDIENKGRLIKTQGVGGLQEVYLIEKLRVKLGKFEREVPVGFIASTKVPPLMGRHGFLETFETLFSYQRQTTFAGRLK